MVTYSDGPGAGPAKTQVSDDDLMEAAAIYMLMGSSALVPEVLASVQDEFTQRLAQAESMGLTEREVVSAVFHPLFSRAKGHCGCAVCRRRCLVCYYRPLLAN